MRTHPKGARGVEWYLYSLIGALYHDCAHIAYGQSATICHVTGHNYIRTAWLGNNGCFDWVACRIEGAEFVVHVRATLKNLH